MKVSDLNPHVKCTICDGYLVDATAIVECLHAFCRTCIVRYLESNHFCPVCDVQVHETKPLLSIRTDQTLQNVVYKVVPGLYQNEMRRRRDFYTEHPVPEGDRETLNPEDLGRGEPRFFAPREPISLSLQHRPKEGKAPAHVQDCAVRHLSCPAAFTVAHLKKFVRLKFGLPDALVVELYYENELLKDDYALMDVAYIHSWERVEPMRFFFSVSRRPLPVPATLPPSEVVPAKGEKGQEGDRRPTTPSELPRPAYNSVKVDLHDAPHNGFRLKFIHDPDILHRPSKKRHRHHHHHHHRPRPRLTQEQSQPPAPTPPPPVSEQVANSEMESPLMEVEEEDCKKEASGDDNGHPESGPEPTEPKESGGTAAATHDLHLPPTPAVQRVCESVQETTSKEEEEEGPPESEMTTTTTVREETAEEQADKPLQQDEEERGCRPALGAPWNRDVEKESIDLPTAVNESPRRNAVTADSISAEFSDDDDLGCQADLVVDEGRAAARDEEEEDLRRKIEAIAAEADDEADSGRASDMSCGPASSSRSACEEEADSPAPPKEEKPRPSSSKSSIDHVIQQLYLRGSSKPPKEESAGALDLSTTPSGTARKEEHHRARVAVANPVLDTKHRQQTYMPAPKTQHTACAPAPRQPLHHGTAPSILQAQLTRPAPRPPHAYVRPPPPSYGYRFGGGQGMFSNMLPYSSSMMGMVPLRKGFLHSRMPFAYGSPQPRDVPKQQQQRPSLRNVCRTSDVSTAITKQQASLRDASRTSGPKQTSLRDVCRTSDTPVTGAPKQTSLRDVCRTSDTPVMGAPKQTSIRDVCRTSDTPVMGAPKQTSIRDVCRTSDVSMTSGPKKTSLRDVCRTSDVSVTCILKQTPPHNVSRTSDLPLTGSPSISPRDACTVVMSVTGGPKQTSVRDVCRTSDVSGTSKQTLLRGACGSLPSPSVSSNNNHHHHHHHPAVHKRSDQQQGGSGGKYRRTLSGGAQLAVFNPNPNEYSRLVIKKMDGGPPVK